MLELLTRYWWAFGVRGALAIFYGLYMFVNRELSLYAFIMASGAFIFIESLLLLLITFGQFARKTIMASIESILGGVIGVAIIFGSGLGSMFMPGVTSVMVPVHIGAWAIVTGAFGSIHAAGLRSQIQIAGALMLGSLLALLCGVWLILHREAGALSFRLPVAAFALLYGLLQTVMVFKAHSPAPRT